MPDIEEDVDVEIKDDHLRIDTYAPAVRADKHINKNILRHTNHPSPHRDRGTVPATSGHGSRVSKAMQMLKAKLYLLKQQEQEQKLSGIQGELTDIGWGSQIRSYVMQPYTMVKDHRTNEESEMWMRS